LRRAEQIDTAKIANVPKHEVVEASAKGAIFIAGNEQLAAASDCTAWPLQSRWCPPTCAGTIAVAIRARARIGINSHRVSSFRNSALKHHLIAYC
jgi:hypothetical protein